jgi:O-antigen ligase
VLLCLLFGGSSQAIWGNALLQLLAIGILGWAALTSDPQEIDKPGRRLLQLAAAVVLLLAVQLIPLPPSLWSAIPGRAFVANGFTLLGLPMPWLPISLAPYDTMTTALTLLPPLALLVGMFRLRSWRGEWMLLAVLVGTAISILLGMLQVTSGDGSWYFYLRTNIGVAVGTFANGNHLATLLLAAVPLLVAFALGRWRGADKPQQRSLTLTLTVASGAVLVIGIVVNGSAAILLIGPPVVVATAMLAMRLSPRRMAQGLLGIVALLGVATTAVVASGAALPAWGTQASVETRELFWSTSLRAAKDHALAGSGVGTFEKVYRQYEDPALVDRWYVNHAHNDYLELALEGGIAAMVLLVLFLLWWGGRAKALWLSPTASLEQKAAIIASAAILLHSAFDYPLRTAAISAVFAVCMALVAGARGMPASKDIDESERPRHATL